MAKVIMTCGLICCGKSTYAKKLQSEGNASGETAYYVDDGLREIMLQIVEEHIGWMVHDLLLYPQRRVKKSLPDYTMIFVSIIEKE